MLKRNDEGPKVKELQETLLELGEALPRWGADGNLGNETFGAVNSLLAKHGRTVDPDERKGKGLFQVSGHSTEVHGAF